MVFCFENTNDLRVNDNKFVINCVDEEEHNLTYNSGSKCLSVLAFVDPIPPHLRIGPGTMFFFSHRKAGVVDRVK